MRLSEVISLTTLITLTKAEVFPLNSQLKPPVISSYSYGDVLPLECIQRQIDNGEHKFDSENHIIYGPFPTCIETGKPFSLQYGVSEDVNCTIQLDDTMFHLFQLYIHEDAPFSCRLPHSKAYKDAYIPLTLNFRGHLETSHLDIDTTMNIIAHKKQDGSLMASIGYSAGDQTARYIIGDKMPIQFSVTWVDEFHKKEPWHYKLNLGFSGVFVGMIALVAGIIGAVLAYALMYGRFNKKFIKDLGYKPGFATELGLEDKRD